jgi:membrane protein
VDVGKIVGMTQNGTPTDKPPASPADIPSHSWKEVARRVLTQIKHDNLTDRAAALTYYGVLALFPGLLVLISILGLVGRSTTDKILNNLEQVAPGGVKSFLTSTVQHVQGRSGAASVAAVIGILLAVWSASGYIAAFMRASNAIYNIDEGRPAWRKISTRLAVTIAIMVLLVLSALLVVLTGQFADQAGKAFGIGHTAIIIWDIAKWPVLLVIVSFMFSLLYWACPNVKQPGFRWISPGGVVAVVIWLVASGLFALYLSFSSSYNKTYGSLAAVIIFLVWLWISNLAVLLGLEFNAETQRQRAIQAGLDPEVEPFVELRSTAKLDDEERSRVEEADRRRAAEMH